MKNVMIIAVAAIMMATAEVKAEEKAPVMESSIEYTMDTNMRSLSRYLKLDSDQAVVMEAAAEDLKLAVSRLETAKEEKKASRMQRALGRNLAYAHECLSAEQYRKYLSLLNTTLRNKGLDTLLENDNIAMSK